MPVVDFFLSYFLSVLYCMLFCPRAH